MNLLLEHNADVNVVNKEGRTPLDLLYDNVLSEDCDFNDQIADISDILAQRGAKCRKPDNVKRKRMMSVRSCTRSGAKYGIS